MTITLDSIIPVGRLVKVRWKLRRRKLGSRFYVSGNVTL